MGNWPDLKDLNREAEQRSPIIDLWKEAGMTWDDVVLLGDVYEIISRDFLRALQVCDFPELRRPDNEVNDPP